MRTSFVWAFAALFLFAPVSAHAADPMPPNQLRLLEALKDRGVIPADATPTEAQAAYQAYVSQKVGQGEDRVNRVAANHLAEGEQSGQPSNHHGRAVRPNNVHFDNVVTLLVEFAGEDGGMVGPLHNQIAEPGPGDNTTFWTDDFAPAHYQAMLFDRNPKARSMSNYYLEQSGGRYTLDGLVTDWVQLPHSEWYYGADNPLGGHDNLNGPAWRLVADAVALACDVPWAEFDTEDPYDLDGDGVYAEPDGYVDHLQVVHAGEGQEAGGGAQGDDAIWSHSWDVGYDPALGVGPGLGGAPTCDPNVWVSPYTINPEDGTIGVFVHEFGHDLGLPDLYDTQNDSEPSTASWTLMSSGSWVACPGDYALGTCPSAMGPWEKWLLGWLEPLVVYPGEVKQNVQLREATSRGFAGKAIQVRLPNYRPALAPPHSGSFEWFSGSGNRLENTLTRTVTLPATGAALTYWTWYDIEEDWDYGYVEVSTDGTTWATVPGNLTTSTDPYGNNGEGNGLTGKSGGWVAASHDLSAWADSTVQLRFRYSTDAYVANAGWYVDDIAVGAFFDDVEGGPGDWVADGWSISDGYGPLTFQYYLAEWRTPTGFDVGMNNWHQWVSGQAVPLVASPGMVLWYRDGAFSNNWAGAHPFEGMLLVVDAHPRLVLTDGLWPYSWYLFGAYPYMELPFGTDIQIADAAFGLSPTPEQQLYSWYGLPTDAVVPGMPGTATFDDSQLWYDPMWADYYGSSPYGYYLRLGISSVATPTYGLKIHVVQEKATGGQVTVDFSGFTP